MSKPSGDTLKPNERAALTAKLVAMGIKGTDLASIITAGKTRGQIADELKTLTKVFPPAAAARKKKK